MSTVSNSAPTLPPGIVDAPSAPPAPPPGGASPSRRWTPVLVSLAIITAAGLGCVPLFRTLSAIDNSPETYQEFAGVVAWWAFAAGAVVAALAAVVWFATRERPDRSGTRLRRAAVTALVALPVGFALWWAPMLFVVTRYLTYVLLGFAAARLAIASVAPARGGGGGVGAPAWVQPVAAVGAGAMAARMLLLMKLNELAWAFAID